MPPPDVVVVGHATRDLADGGWRLGGTVTFAAVQAHRLGCSVGIVTRTAGNTGLAETLGFADVRDAGSPITTTFENVYAGGRRSQHIRTRAEPIIAADVPDAWRAASIVLLGPVFGEVPAGFARVFSGGLVGVSAQGWLRDAGADGRVRHAAWAGAPFWDGSDAVFASDDDLGGDESDLAAWCGGVPVVAVTESRHGLRVCEHGAWRRMSAFPEEEIDPTGAGDTFATGFLVRWRETGDVAASARFGAAAASLSVGGIGVAAMPGRAEVEERLARYPDIALR